MTHSRTTIIESVLALPDAELAEVMSAIAKSGRLGAESSVTYWRTVAGLLELETLRVGTHYLRDAEGYRVGSFWVSRWWAIEVRPAFKKAWMLAGAVAIGQEFRRTKTTGWMKVALATPDGSATMSIDEDPVMRAIGALDLADVTSHPALDGVGYRLVVHSDALRATIEFANPTQASLVALERATRELARTVALNSGQDALMSPSVLG
jgi:hypothetical protein